MPLSNPILDVAFIVAATAFFKTRLSLVGWQALLCAFVVSLIVGLTPVASAAFPAVAPWLQAVVSVIALFIGAAGSYDAIIDFRNKKA